MTNKITLDRELADLLYRALNGGDTQLSGTEHGRAFRELRAALAEQAQGDAQPVALPTMKNANSEYDTEDSYGDGWDDCLREIAKLGPLYARPAPAKVEPVPPAGGEVEALIDQLDDYIARINGDDRGSDATVNELRAHVTRLQAEVERLDLMVAQADYNYDMDRAEFKRQLAKQVELLQDEIERRRLRGQTCAKKVAILRAQLSERDALIAEVIEDLQGQYPTARLQDALSASAEPGVL